MPDSKNSELQPSTAIASETENAASTSAGQNAPENGESFKDLLSAFEKSSKPKRDADPRQIDGIVVALTADSVLVDIGYKSEGILPLSVFTDAGESVKPGDHLLVTVKG